MTIWLNRATKQGVAVALSDKMVCGVCGGRLWTDRNCFEAREEDGEFIVHCPSCDKTWLEELSE